MLDQLSPLLLRQIALHMVDPSGLAGAFLAAWRLVKDEAFVFEWFSRWQLIITPYRPWQYSIITWRHGSAAQQDAKQLASFMLRYLSWQKEQKQRRATVERVCLTSSDPISWAPGCTTATTSADSAPNLSLQTAGTLQSAADGPTVLPQQQPARQSVGSGVSEVQLLQRSDLSEGTISSYPCCQPAPATTQKARKLLANGHGVAALMLLCPASGTLLLPYVTKSCKRGMLRQILGAKRSGPQFPYCYLNHSKLLPQFPAVEIACYAALRAGASDTLMLFLASKQGACSYLAHPLLRFAAQHSNATCIEQLLLYVAATDTASLSPCHLAAAAARGDDEAAGVVDLLLDHLPVKQRTAKWLKSTYAAACISGSAEVLQVLLRHVAATADNKKQHQRHIVALLEACGESGNVGFWEWLLAGQQLHPCSSAASSSSRCGSSSSAFIPGTAQQQQQQREQQPPPLPLATADLAPEQWVRLLHAVLPCSNLEYQHTRTADQQQACSDRLRMADQLWVLVQAAGQDTAVQQLVAVCPKPDTPLVPSAAALQLLNLDITEEGHVAITNNTLLERLWWLQMHGLMLQGILGEFVLRTVWYWLGPAFREGEYSHALRLYRMWHECEAAFHDAQQTATAPTAEATAAAAMESVAGVAGCAVDALVESATVATRQQHSAADADLSEPTLSAGSELEAAVHTLDAAAAAVLVGAGSAHSAAAPAAAGAPQQLAQTPQPATAVTPEQSLQLPPVAAAAAAPSLASAPIPDTASSNSVTLEKVAQRDLHRAADMLLSARFAAAVAGGDLTSMQQIVGMLVNGPLSSDTETVFDASWHLPQWLCSKKLCRDAAAHRPSSQPGLNCEAVNSNKQHQDKEGPVATVSSSTSAPLASAGFNVSSSGDSASKPGCSQQQQQQQQQHGFQPLWQLVLLQLLSGTSPQAIDLCLASIRRPNDLLSRGVGVQQLQALADAQLLGNFGFCHFGSTGVDLAGAATQQVQPSVLAWTLQPQQRHLWSIPGRVQHTWDRVLLYYGSYCNPIDCRSRSYWCSLEKEEQQQLQQQHQQQLFEPPLSAGVAAAPPPQPGPAFLQSSTQLALLMLQQPPPTDHNMLSLWISKSVGAHSSKLVVARAKAILAAVATSTDIPWGAKIVHPAALRKVLAAGDVDLLAMLLMWAARLPVELEMPTGADGMDVDGGAGFFEDVLGDLPAFADGNGVPGLDAVLGLDNDI